MESSAGIPISKYSKLRNQWKTNWLLSISYEENMNLFDANSFSDQVIVTWIRLDCTGIIFNFYGAHTTQYTGVIFIIIEFDGYRFVVCFSLGQIYRNYLWNTYNESIVVFVCGKPFFNCVHIEFISKLRFGGIIPYKLIWPIWAELMFEIRRKSMLSLCRCRWQWPFGELVWFSIFFFSSIFIFLIGANMSGLYFLIKRMLFVRKWTWIHLSLVQNQIGNYKWNWKKNWLFFFMFKIENEMKLW